MMMCKRFFYDIWTVQQFWVLDILHKRYPGVCTFSTCNKKLQQHKYTHDVWQVTRLIFLCSNWMPTSCCILEHTIILISSFVSNSHWDLVCFVVAVRNLQEQCFVCSSKTLLAPTLQQDSCRNPTLQTKSVFGDET